MRIKDEIKFLHSKKTKTKPISLSPTPKFGKVMGQFMATHAPHN